VAGDGTTAVVEGVVVGAVSNGVVAGPVVSECAIPRISRELVIGPVVRATHMARTQTTAAAPPSNVARQPGLASAAATSRVRRP
jgi:hypothetical protein